MATTSPATTITVNGRHFAVTTESDKYGRPIYNLRGKRGAHYFTMRNEPNPAMMFLCDARGLGCATTMKGVWLTDEGGELKAL